MWTIGSQNDDQSRNFGTEPGVCPKMSMVERVRSQVSAHDEESAADELPIEFGKWTDAITCTSFDGIPTITATDNKIIELAPTARGGVGMPEGARGQWTFKLEQAKGIVSIGMAGLGVALGMPFRKPELRDQVWYYTASDGVLRNGARSVGRRGPVAATGDTVTMRLAHNQLSFLVNDVEIQDAIPNLTGAPLFAIVQIHRKDDAVSLRTERFDADTLQHIKFVSWGSASNIVQGPMVGHTAVELSCQRTLATSCYKAPDIFGCIVPSVRSAAVVSDGASAEWKVQIESCKSTVYIGLEQVTWQQGLDWWSEAAIDCVWYYSSDGSLRTGNSILARSHPLPPRPLPQSTEKTDTGNRKASISSSIPLRMPHARITPNIPPLSQTDCLTLKLSNRTLSFAVNDTLIEEKIQGVHGSVRLCVQFEDDGDALSILPR